jgi:hypothetical protein
MSATTICPSSGNCPLGLEKDIVRIGDRVKTLEDSHAFYRDKVDRDTQKLAEKIDKLQYWIMGTLATALGGLLAQLAHR